MRKFCMANWAAFAYELSPLTAVAPWILGKIASEDGALSWQATSSRADHHFHHAHVEGAELPAPLPRQEGRPFHWGRQQDTEYYLPRTSG